MPILTAGLNEAAFLANGDGTWTVICDTKIVENCAAPLSNTLHLPDGTVIERGMFRLRNLDAGLLIPRLLHGGISTFILPLVAFEIERRDHLHFHR
jgi:hypothetical protein